MAIDEMSFVVTTLERINSKLDKHDEKFDMIVLSMQQLVKVDTENKEIKESLARVFKRLESVEHNQNSDGCQAHKNFVSLRNEQLVHYKELVDTYKEKQDTLEDRIETLEQKPMKLIDKFVLAVVAVLGAGLGGFIMTKLGVSK
jgi:hypothetical protein